MPRKLSHDEFIQEFYKNNLKAEYIRVLSEYRGYEKPIECECVACSYRWAPKARNLIRGCGCPRCSMKAAGHWRKTQEEFVKEVSISSPGIEIVGKYVNNKTPVRVRCTSCGLEWDENPRKLLRKTLCRQCASGKQHPGIRSSHEEYLSALKNLNPAIECLGIYESAHKKILHKCKSCGHVWSITPHNALKGHACPNCSHSQTSFTERFIYESLKVALGETEVFWRSKDVIDGEIDIFMPSFSFGVEPGSWYWHEKKVWADEAKTKNNVRVLTIYDSYPDGAAPPFDNCLVFSFDLSREKGHATLKKIVLYILEEIDHQHEFTEREFEEITRKAQMYSMRKTHEKFVEELAESNPSIECASVYEYATKSMRFTCRKCGYEWEAQPNIVLGSRSRKGTGCPKCSGRCKTDREFKEELKKKFPNIVHLDVYTKATSLDKFKCNTCGYVWNKTPHSLMRTKHGCPKCWGGAKKSDNNSV